MIAEGQRVDLTPKYTWARSVRCLSCETSFPVEECSEEVKTAVEKIEQSSSATQEVDLKGIADAADEVLPCVHTGNLEQIPNPPQLAHKGSSDGGVFPLCRNV